MLANERRERIKNLIRSRHNIKISELSELFGVSEMTIHRDIKPLVEEGIVIKTFGGITIARKEPEHAPGSNDCVFCHRKIDRRLSYRLILPENKVEATCCAHCGLLRHQQLGDKAIQAICHDFLFHTTISAPMAYFVMDALLDIGCCQPQVLTFGKKEHAEGFVKGFGGLVLSFSEALERVHVKMECCGTDKSPPTV
ncbi:MAG: DeoR/GlpR transcriptional regulator [Actinobacteria bacterium]|nr:DeoR/GlpR transcriptional regulator [Actinomycetota bacterium]